MTQTILGVFILKVRPGRADAGADYRAFFRLNHPFADEEPIRR